MRKRGSIHAQKQCPHNGQTQAEPREFGKQGARAHDAKRHQAKIAQETNASHHGDVLLAQALFEQIRILRADGDDQTHAHHQSMPKNHCCIPFTVWWHYQHLAN